MVKSADDIDAARLKSRIADLAPEFEERLGALCARASVSMDPGRHGEMEACAALASDYLREAGARVDPIDDRRIPDRARPLHPETRLPDGHRLQPPGRAAGRRPRLEDAAVRADAQRGDPAGAARWFARGTTDDKGPALTALYGARLAPETGVPANIRFLWELEEEIGCPNFEAGLVAAVAGNADAAAPVRDRLGRRLRHDLGRRRQAGDLRTGCAA